MANLADMPGFANAAHNDWAQWTAEGGIPCAVAMLSILIWCARRALQAPWALGLPVLLVHCLFDFPMQIPAIALLSFVMLGALAGRDGCAT